MHDSLIFVKSSILFRSLWTVFEPNNPAVCSQRRHQSWQAKLSECIHESAVIAITLNFDFSLYLIFQPFSRELNLNSCDLTCYIKFAHEALSKPTITNLTYQWGQIFTWICQVQAQGRGIFDENELSAMSARELKARGCWDGICSAPTLG